jgi:hypothetical protein
MKLPFSNIDKLYIAAFGLCLLSFAFPSIEIVIAGQTYNQYFIGTYGGQIAFTNLLLFGGILQLVVFILSKKWLKWVGFVCGLYASIFAASQLYKCFIRFTTNRPATLVDRLQPECFPLAGVWLLLAAGVTLLTVSAIKILSRSLKTKQLTTTTGQSTI